MHPIIKDRAFTSLAESFADHGPMARVVIISLGTSASNATEFFRVFLVTDDRHMLEITGRVASATTYRFNEKRGAISVGGYGTSRSLELKLALERLFPTMLKVQVLA